MAGPTMAELITQVRRRADVENSTFVTNPELQDYLNDSIADLFTELREAWGDEYFVDEETVTVPAGSVGNTGCVVDLVPAEYADPPLRILGIGLHLPSQSRVVPLKPFSPSDTVLRLDPLSWEQNPPRYKLLGLDTLQFEYPPTTAMTIIVRAIEQPARYTEAGGLEIDEVFSWREYVIVDAAIKVLAKEESDTGALEARKQWLLSRIRANAPPRDVQAKTMVDARALQEGYALGWWE